MSLQSLCLRSSCEGQGALAPVEAPGVAPPSLGFVSILARMKEDDWRKREAVLFLRSAEQAHSCS